MSGADYLAVLLLAGFLMVTVAFDQLRNRRNRRLDEDCTCWICSQTREHRRQRELEQKA